jgi:hypothetical protein
MRRVASSDAVSEICPIQPWTDLRIRNGPSPDSRAEGVLNEPHPPCARQQPLHGPKPSLNSLPRPPRSQPEPSKTPD